MVEAFGPTSTQAGGIGGEERMQIYCDMIAENPGKWNV
jgi:hypothetical protein